MAKPSAALVAAQKRIAALEARIDAAKTVYRNQRAQIDALEAALNTRGVKPAVVHVTRAPETKISYFTKADGTRWCKERTGNKARSYQVQ